MAIEKGGVPDERRRGKSGHSWCKHGINLTDRCDSCDAEIGEGVVFRVDAPDSGRHIVSVLKDGTVRVELPLDAGEAALLAERRYAGVNGSRNSSGDIEVAVVILASEVARLRRDLERALCLIGR